MKIGYKMPVIIVGLFFLSACQYMPMVSLKELNSAYVKKTEAEAQVAALAKAHSEALTNNEKKLSESKDKVITGQDVQLQSGADALYTIQQITSIPAQPGTLELTRARAVEGFTAMGKPPTIKEIIEGGDRLRKYLTTYQNNDPIEIDKLRAEHARLVKENGILVETTKLAKKEVETTKAEKEQIQTKYIGENAVVQQNLNKANEDVAKKERERAEAEKKRSDESAAIWAAKRELMIWCGIGAALALVGAVYSPVGKGGLATIAGILACVTVAIPFVQGWMILVGAISLFAVAIGYMLYKHHISEKANENIVNAIEDTKQKPDATLSDLKENLKEWNTTYAKDKAGNVITKTDTDVEKYIREKLMKSGRLVIEKKVKNPLGSSQ